MPATRKLAQHARKRKASDAFEANDCDNEQTPELTQRLSDDLQFLAPNQMCHAASHLLFCLTTKRLINLPFSNLYHRSLRHGWLPVLKSERRSLKPNINSLEKCFVLNRLIEECTKDPIGFAQRAAKLYEEMLTRMSSTSVPFTTPHDLYTKIVAYQDLLCQQRLFYIDHDDPRQAYTFLGLQQATTQLCAQFISSCETSNKYMKIERRNQLRELLQHAFLIVAEPTSSECVAAAKYEKRGDAYTVKLTTRIVCLLEIDQIRTHFTFSPVAVTLYSFDRHSNEEGEIQAALEWKSKRVLDAKGHSKLLYYAELQSINLTKPDAHSSRPLYSAKLCQLHFRLKINIPHLNMEENFTFFSRPFGICSHSQYFPEYVAKVLLYELEQNSLHTGSSIQPHTVTDGICRYHTRVAGVAPKSHTQHFILRQCQALYDKRTNETSLKSHGLYEEILTKLISQIEFYVDHPVLSMMYHDSLFLGICDSTVDESICGTRDELHILLRFDTLDEHQPTQPAAVRYIVHNGHLIKATFQQKAFIEDMCRTICEALSEKAKRSRILSDVPHRTFHDFSLYFDKEIYRLTSVGSPIKEAYQPLIPVLWSIMRSTTDDEPIQVPVRSPSIEDDSTTTNTTSLHQIRTSPSADTTTTNSSKNHNETMTSEAEKLTDFLLEKLPQICVKVEPLDTSLSPDSTVTTPIDLFTAVESATQQYKLLLSSLLHDYFHSIVQVPASKHVTDRSNNSKSDAIQCSSSSVNT